MASFLEKAREKSEAEKKKLAFVWALSITLCIFLIWVLSFSASVINKEVVKEDDFFKDNLASPVENIKDQFDSIFK
jgi:hypothetical protein